MIKPKETRYRGYRFRSRLEARWAVFFDALNIPWEYEPQGYELGNGISYLPDFWFPEFGCFGEVKPEKLDRRSLVKVQMLCKGTDCNCVLLEGTPEVKTYEILTDGYLKSVLLWKHKERRFYWADEPLAENDIEEHEPEIYPHLKRAVEAARSARFEWGEKPCTQAEVDEYNTFAALSLDERRRRVYAKFITTFPNSPLTKDILSGRIQLPKPRGRNAAKRKPKQKILFTERS